MRRKPDNGQGQRDHEHQKYQPSFAPFFAHGSAAAALKNFIAIAFVLQGNGNIKTPAAFARTLQNFLTLPARSFLRHARRLLDHAFQLAHALAQFRFLQRQLFLFLIKRRFGFRRSTRHAGSRRFRRQPEKEQKPNENENDERKRKRKPDLHPLHETFATAQAANVGCNFWQWNIVRVLRRLQSAALLTPRSR